MFWFIGQLCFNIILWFFGNKQTDIIDKILPKGLCIRHSETMIVRDDEYEFHIRFMLAEMDRSPPAEIFPMEELGHLGEGGVVEEPGDSPGRDSDEVLYRF